MDPSLTAGPPGRRSNPWPALAVAWLALCIFGQVAHLAAWPLLVWGRPLSLYGTRLLAFARIGIYFGIAWGIARGSRRAAAGFVVELARAFVVFVLATRLNEGSLAGVVYPAGWADGLLSGAVPALVTLNVMLDAGWRGGQLLVTVVQVAAQVAAGLAAWSVYWLGRDLSSLTGSPEDSLRKPHEVLLDGLPLAVVLTIAELLALKITG